MLPGCQPGNKRGKKEEAKTNQVTYAFGIFLNEMEGIGDHKDTRQGLSLE